MTDKIITTTIDILGKLYPIRCPESELKSLQQAAAFLNQKMLEVKESGKAINVERIAIITALNIAYQFLQSDQQKTSLMSKINQRITLLQDKLDTTINKAMQTELIYTAE
ncbi:cell division protein ZapA [Aquicella lusitana]|uniref:Cell division protein ZapA n=1 Tax=Aquicella lusitana TaxID=254246 RepID=A0A370GTD8_9COXI|nr:cell division protein ZapA [Aquicella lusitana]RDI46526.1 cell division protein ZapA [Aquicella lusitana]VVC74190.1 Cell division protein ZapA [Aquicella lusitana]